VVDIVLVPPNNGRAMNESIRRIHGICFLGMLVIGISGVMSDQAHNKGSICHGRMRRVTVRMKRGLINLVWC
jgi:hypothetical protein